MTCFWQRFVSADDPDCIVAPTTRIYIAPGYGQLAFGTNINNSGPLSIYDQLPPVSQVFPTSATVISVSVYAPVEGSSDPSCEIITWGQGWPTSVESPPLGALLHAPYSVAISWDAYGSVSPTNDFPIADILVACEFTTSDAGLNYIWSPDTAYHVGGVILVMTIQTDLGIGLYVYSPSACY